MPPVELVGRIECLCQLAVVRLDGRNQQVGARKPVNCRSDLGERLVGGLPMSGARVEHGSEHVCERAAWHDVQHGIDVGSRRCIGTVPDGEAGTCQARRRPCGISGRERLQHCAIGRNRAAHIAASGQEIGTQQQPIGQLRIERECVVEVGLSLREVAGGEPDPGRV